MLNHGLLPEPPFSFDGGGRSSVIPGGVSPNHRRERSAMSSAVRAVYDFSTMIVPVIFG
jgi:hypothetical protein